jgi:hypothetical protein
MHRNNAVFMYIEEFENLFQPFSMSVELLGYHLRRFEGIFSSKCFDSMKE